MPKQPLNPVIPKAIESIEGLKWNTKLIVLEDRMVRLHGAFHELKQGQIVRVDLHGGLVVLEQLLEGQRVRFALAEPQKQEENKASAEKAA